MSVWEIMTFGRPEGHTYWLVGFNYMAWQVRFILVNDIGLHVEQVPIFVSENQEKSTPFFKLPELFLSGTPRTWPVWTLIRAFSDV